jgi:hypothetical protein
MINNFLILQWLKSNDYINNHRIDKLIYNKFLWKSNDYINNRWIDKLIPLQ